MQKTIGVIQARIGSTRLPYKMMLSLHGKPLIEWVVKRVQKSKLLSSLIVLNRIYESVKNENATHVVRICADNPLIDGNEIDNLINFYNTDNCNYAYNHIPKDNLYPDGLGAEIISFDILNDLNKKVITQNHKEHCFSYIHDNSEKYSIATFNPIDNTLHHPELKFDVDTFDDYHKLCMKDFDMDISSQELIKLFTENKI